MYMCGDESQFVREDKKLSLPITGMGESRHSLTIFSCAPFFQASLSAFVLSSPATASLNHISTRGSIFPPVSLEIGNIASVD